MKEATTTEIYTLSLHDALPIWNFSASRTNRILCSRGSLRRATTPFITSRSRAACYERSEEHTSELQSQSKLVCRLLLEKKNDENVDVDAALEGRRKVVDSTRPR